MEIGIFFLFFVHNALILAYSISAMGNDGWIILLGVYRNTITITIPNRDVHKVVKFNVNKDFVNE